jgi:hypothetical protein
LQLKRTQFLNKCTDFPIIIIFIFEYVPPAGCN